METMFFAGVVLLFLQQFGPGIALILASFLLYLYKYFYYARLEMGQAAMASQTLQGQALDPKGARAKAKENRKTYRIIAALNFLAKRLEKAQRKGKSGLSGFLLSIVMAGALQVWDLVSHYLLPAAVIDGHGPKEGVATMKRLEEHVPATLVGVFGIDMAGRAVGTIMAPIYLVLIVVSVALGFVVGEAVAPFYIGEAAALFAELEVEQPIAGPLHFSILLLLAAIWIGKFGSVVLDRITTSVKVLYFTTFYLRIMHPDAIAPELKEPLEQYLRMEDAEGRPTVAHGKGSPAEDPAAAGAGG